MFVEVLKAFCIGICASMPLGPVAILVIQKSLCYGHRAGWVTGLGATTVDTTYATIAIFALALAEHLIDRFHCLIYLVGGLIVILVGASMAFRDPFRKLGSPETERGASIRDYFQAVATALSNPGAIFIMLALFAFFRMDPPAGEEGVRVLPLILAVACGSALYWSVISGIFSHLRRAFKLQTLIWMGRIAGIIIMILGIALLGEGLFQAVFRNGLSTIT